MRVGFTGTQVGLSEIQRDTLGRVLGRLGPTAFHHGDCVGADAEAHAIALARAIPVTVHPPLDARKEAFCRGAASLRPPLPYLQRNRAIVDATEVLVACPRQAWGEPEELRSGTWATVRYARRLGRPVFVAWRDGPASGERGAWDLLTPCTACSTEEKTR